MMVSKWLMKDYEWQISKTYLISRRKDKFISLTAILSIIAIALGVAALIIVMSVMNGFRAELVDKILGYHGHVIIQGYEGEIKNFKPLQEDLHQIEGVQSVTAYSENQVIAMKNGRAWGGIVRGLPDQLFLDNQLRVASIKSGDITTAVDEGGVVIGYQLARRLGLTAGSDLTIVSPTPVDTPFGSTLRTLQFPVVAVVELGVYQFDEVFIAMPLSLAQPFFKLGDHISHMEIFLNDPDQISQAIDPIRNIVGKQAYASPWTEFNQALVGALQTERVAMFMILSLIILVAVFNISSSLFMLVKDKSGDIAILKTIGMSQRAVARIFVTMGMLVGTIGVVSGCLLAGIIIYYLEGIKRGIEALLGLDLWDPSVRFISEMRAEVNLSEVALTIAIALILSWGAALIPARRASKIDPIDILRYEK